MYGGQVEYLSPVDKRTETDDHRRKPKRAIEVEEEVPLAEVKKTEGKQKKEDGNPNRSDHNGVVFATSPR